MNKWEIALIVSGAYLAAGVATLAYAAAKGSATGTSFDGITGNESNAVKAIECVLLWPVALPKTITAK